MRLWSCAGAQLRNGVAMLTRKLLAGVSAGLLALTAVMIGGFGFGGSADPAAAMGAQVSSAWTGAALFSFNAEAQAGPIQPGDGSAYDPSAGRWARLPRAPSGCAGQVTPVWTGHQVLVVCPSGRGSGVALIAGR